jgi:membrane protease YdiL (CAAX protease family)
MNNYAKASIFYAMTLGQSLAAALFLAPIIGAYSLPVVMMTPLISVLIMKLLVTREGFRRGGWADLGLSTMGLKSWGLALGLPFLILLVSYGAVWMLGLAGVGVPQNLIDVLLNALINLGMGLVLCVGEETGWRGYLLPKLTGLGLKPALLLSGLLQGLWHVPFIIFTTVYHSDGNQWLVVPLFISTMSVAGVLFGYLRVKSGSTWPAVLGHAIFNTYWTLFNAVTIGATALATEYLAGETGLFTLIGVIVSAAILVRQLEGRSAVRFQPA